MSRLKKRVKLVCPQCLKEFEIVQCRLNYHKNHYCSLICLSRFTAKNRANKLRKKVYPCKVGECNYCKKDIIAKNSSFDKPTRKFCSKNCRQLNFNKNQYWWTSKLRKQFAKTARKRFLGKKLTFEQRLKRRDNNLGEKSHFWRGGVTKENLKRRAGIEYREWRKAVYERDNYTCQDCGARSGNGKTIYLNADHIKPWALYPELRYEVSNGRTLCLPCHHKTPTFGYKSSIMKRVLLSDTS